MSQQLGMVPPNCEWLFRDGPIATRNDEATKTHTHTHTHTRHAHPLSLAGCLKPTANRAVATLWARPSQARPDHTRREGRGGGGGEREGLAGKLIIVLRRRTGRRALRGGPLFLAIPSCSGSLRQCTAGAGAGAAGVGRPCIVLHISLRPERAGGEADGGLRTALPALAG